VKNESSLPTCGAEFDISRGKLEFYLGLFFLTYYRLTLYTMLLRSSSVSSVSSIISASSAGADAQRSSRAFFAARSIM